MLPSWHLTNIIGNVAQDFLGIVSVGTLNVIVERVELCKGVMVQAHAEARARWNRQFPVTENQFTACDHIMVCPRIMRVAVVGKIGRGRRDMGHRSEADPEMCIGMHLSLIHI